MKISRSEKEQVVTKLKDKMSQATAFVVADYHGLSVEKMQKLKNSLKPLDAEFIVSKNTLVTRAIAGTEKVLPEESLTGPTALLISYGDPIEAVKKLAEFIKENELPNIKIGFLEGQVLEKQQVLALSKIPSKNELYAKVVGSINSPLYGIVSVLNGNLSKLVYVLKAVQDAKGGAS